MINTHFLSYEVLSLSLIKLSMFVVCMHKRHLVLKQILKPLLGDELFNLPLTIMSFKILGRLNAAISGS